MLTADQDELWMAYEVAERRGVREASLRALEAFVRSLAASPAEDWHPWARGQMARFEDGDRTLVVRQPLLDRVIFPAVLAGFRAGLPDCTRWLAQFALLLDRSEEGRALVPPAERTELELLRRALRENPADHRACHRLLGRLADGIAFTLHELPLGVLYGMNGATSDQCRELEDVLEEVRRLAAEAGVSGTYGDLVERAAFHYRAYREYLAGHDPGVSYAAFLAIRGAGNEQ